MTAYSIGIVALCLALTMAIHEVAHIVCAKFLGKKILRVGVSFKPLPHFFITIDGVLGDWERILYLLSGVATISILALALHPIYSMCLLFKIAIFTQIIIDTNPFYSDVALVCRILTTKNKRQEYTLQNLSSDYQYTHVWYIHLVFWLTAIILTLKYL